MGILGTGLGILENAGKTAASDEANKLANGAVGAFNPGSTGGHGTVDFIQYVATLARGQGLAAQQSNGALQQTARNVLADIGDNGEGPGWIAGWERPEDRNRRHKFNASEQALANTLLATMDMPAAVTPGNNITTTGPGGAAAVAMPWYLRPAAIAAVGLALLLALAAFFFGRPRAARA